MIDWTKLNINDTLWLINRNGELLSTKIHTKEIGTYAGQDSYGYTFNIKDETGYNIYKLVITIGSEHSDVKYRRFYLADSRKLVDGYKAMSELYFVSPDKIKLIEVYIEHEQKDIENIIKDIDDLNIELANKYSLVDKYNDLLKQEQNDNI